MAETASSEASVSRRVGRAGSHTRRTGRAPAERGTWAAEGSERGRQGGEAQVKLAVVVGQADEAADIGAQCVHNVGVAHSATVATLQGSK